MNPPNPKGIINASRETPIFEIGDERNATKDIIIFFAWYRP